MANHQKRRKPNPKTPKPQNPKTPKQFKIFELVNNYLKTRTNLKMDDPEIMDEEEISEFYNF